MELYYYIACFFILIETYVVVGKDVYTYEALDIYGDRVSFEKYRGTVSILVNVASECGYTDSNYISLTKVANYFESSKVNILAFPSNDFGAQEPGTDIQILRFVEQRYGTNLDLFSKISVAGDYAHPLWKYIGEVSGMPPNWNFWKYLVSKDGVIVGAWGPWDSIDNALDKINDEINEKVKPKKRVSGASPPAPIKPSGSEHLDGAKPPSKNYKPSHKESSTAEKLNGAKPPSRNFKPGHKEL